jgi:thiamine pyrophosphate-dependent acetolactate synthase large subunit-like protein
MADGYSRASGNVGVVLVGGAVGLTNCVNALLTAIKAHSRVLVIVGETAGGTSDAAQLMRKFIDQHGLLGVLRARHHDAAAASAAADAQACYELAAGGGELVVMGIPERAGGDGHPGRGDARGGGRGRIRPAGSRTAGAAR